MQSEQRTAPGRPRAASSHAVAAAALRLFIRDGYDETTMQRIADEVQISRPTLFRYFPSKADIVWDRYDDEATELRALLAAADPAAEPLDVLCTVLPGLLQYPEGDRDVLRAQVTLIASVPAVQAQLQSRTAEWVGILAGYVAGRIGGSPDDLLPQVLSRCVWSAGWTALTVWAAGDEVTPDRELNRAFEALRHGFSLSSLT